MNAANQDIRDESRCTAMNSLPDLSDEQFMQWVSLINDRTGMHFPIERKSFLTTNIRIRMQAAGFSDYENYYEFVTSGPRGMVEWVTLTDHLTVQETCFNRHVASYDAIREYCQKYVQSNNSEQATSLQVLSMGCATGEEPYTLAIVIDGALSRLEEKAYFGIMAVDISSGALVTAREGLYGKRRLQELEPELKEKYFTQLDDVYQVNDYLRKHVCFSRLNIMELDKAPLEDMDIIMCQNLLIYFEQQQRKELLNSLSAHLKPGGILVLGVGEVIGWNHPELERVKHQDTLIYRRKSASREGAGNVNG